MTAPNESGLIVVLRKLKHFYIETSGKHRFHLSNGEDIYLELELADVERVYDSVAPREKSTQCFEPPIEQYEGQLQILFVDAVKYAGVNLGKHVFRDEACQKEFRIPYSVIELIAESENGKGYQILASFGRRQPEPQTELPY